MNIWQRPITTEDLDVFAAGDVREWVAFDVGIRGAWWTDHRWYRGNLGKTLERRPSRPALAEAACHGNGYLREAAVEALGSRTDPETLPLLLIRCLDWVAPVRDRARTLVASKLDDDVLRPMLPLIEVLSRRTLGTWMTDLFRWALLSDALFEDALAHEDSATRRWVHAEAILTDRLPLDRLVQIALQDKDFTVRARCGAAVLDSGDTEAIRQVLTGGTRAVRARALVLFDVEVAEQHLTDPSSPVRSMAQALVLKAGGDPAAHYRALLAGGVVTPATVAGLGETGGQSDVDGLVAHFTAECPRVRAAAVRGLRRLTPDDTHELVRPMLTDPAPRVVRQAVALLKGLVRRADEPYLAGLLEPGNALHIRRGALALLRGNDSWTRLVSDLRLVATPTDPLAEDAGQDLTRWQRESATLYTRPAPGTAAEIDALLTRLEATLDPATTRAIRFTMTGRP